MERVREKMEEIIRKQKGLQENAQAATQSGSANDKSQYLIAAAGVAAGLTIALIFGLAKSILVTDHGTMMAPERAEAVHTGDINKPSDDIAQLNKRVESLTESVSSLEAKLTRVMVLTDSITNSETRHAGSSGQQTAESTAAKETSNVTEASAPRAVQRTSETEKAFVPTHTVKARVNLRPSASLKSTPIAVLDVGTEVQYIRRSDGWYYVNTLSHGKGWCSSDYLSPLPGHSAAQEARPAK
jgi:hypothetical protein